ncbi:MAG: FAD-dependent oxidoreductase [Planctomycetes bacterium]|nr:FAD-dependent oxidoreductase [Planctomycetota bacterium]
MGSTKQYDVVILGGGVAGVAAAMQCGHLGLKTALVEKTILWGGLATSGLVPIYMPLCDGKGRQVTGGIAEELLWASIKYGPGRLPQQWTGHGQPAAQTAGGTADEELYDPGSFANRFQTFFSPHAFALGLDEALESCGADLWLDTLACKPILSGKGVSGIEVENKSGRIAIEARCVIDATGEADIAFRSGAACQERGSYPSMLYQATSLELARQAVAADNARKAVTWRGGGAANEMDKGYDGTSPKTMGTDGKTLSAWIMESRRIARENLLRDQAKAATDNGLGRENLYPAVLPTMHQIRMSRMIEGQETVLTDRMNQRCETSIGLIADCRKSGAVWEVPYGALLPKKVENLLVIGRCSSAEGYAWQVTRLIGACALTGQVAGLAAQLAISGNTSPSRLDVKDVQRAAEAQSITLHI